VQDIGGTPSKPNPIDDRYLEYSQACQQYGIPFGVYSYCRYKSKAQAEAEAKLFYDRARTGDRRPIFYAVDCEESYITRGNTEAFITRLRSLSALDALDPRPRVKVGAYVAHHLYEKLNLNITTDVTNPATPDFVWIPRYGTNDGTMGSSVLPSYPTDLWQYTSKGSIKGIQGAVDLNSICDKNGNKLSQKSTFDFAWLTTP
jgi:GH25 family lysozyme M1 (1,4-beta-N-acetylmuramidase)